MACGRCGDSENDDGSEMSRVLIFEGEEPTLTELAEYFNSPGLVLCDGCEGDYLNWLSEP